MSTLRALGSIAALAALVVASPRPSPAQKKVPDGAKVLLLTGGERQHHGYREQALYLAGILEDTGHFQVTLAEDAALLLTPAMARYDLVILNADRRTGDFKFTVDQEKALFAYVRDGHGLASIHGADNAPPDWQPEWKEMLGGIYTHVGLPDGRAVKGKYRVRIADKASRTTQGLADFDLDDELYTNMRMMPDIRVLATIDYNGKTWPVAWTTAYGKGRVFHTSLGHRDFGPGKFDPQADPNLQKLLIQGIAFAAGREIPKPDKS